MEVGVFRSVEAVFDFLAVVLRDCFTVDVTFFCGTDVGTVFDVIDGDFNISVDDTDSVDVEYSDFPPNASLAGFAEFVILRFF